MELHKVCKGGRLEVREGERRGEREGGREGGRLEVREGERRGEREGGREGGRRGKEVGKGRREDKSTPPSNPQHTHHSLPSWRRLCDYQYYLIRQHS